MTRNERKLERAIAILKEEYERSQADKIIHKPMANALYKTWKLFDDYEMTREEEGE